MNLDELKTILNPIAQSLSNNDATTGVFLAEQLTQVVNAGYTTEIAVNKGLQHIPMPNLALDGLAQTLKFTVFDGVGMAKIIENYSDDLPTVELFGKQQTANVFELGVSYWFSKNDLALSARNGTALDQYKAVTARRAINAELERLVVYGDEKHNIHGLTTHPNLSTTILPSGKQWLTGNPTAQELYDDVVALRNAVIIQSKETHTPNKLLMPLRHLSLLRSKVFEKSEKSVYARLREDFPDLQIDSMDALADSAGNTGKLIMGEFDANNFFNAITQFFQQETPVQDVLKVVIPCTARTAGFVLRMPLSLTSATA